LDNWAVTTGTLLSQSGLFNHKLIMRIDASTILAVKDKTVQAYDSAGKRIYRYSDNPEDSILFDQHILSDARSGAAVYFRLGNREGMAHHFTGKNYDVVMVAAAFDEEGKRKLLHLRYILLLSLTGGIIIAVGAGFIFSKGLLIPLRKIADEVNEISVLNLAGRIKSGTEKDEWNYLSDTLNNLLNRLQGTIEIHRRFIANASHELSTPLTSVISQLEVSLSRERDAADYRNVMHSIYQDVRQLSKLTQTLLEFARASGDPGGIGIDLVRMDEILLAMPAELLKINSDYVVSIIFDQLPEEEERLLVFGNEELLFTAIKNLVINGCKYSSDHHTHITLSARENLIVVRVCDDGIGMAEKELQNIFQPFYRVNESQQTQGFGLGLSLSKQIIQLHKGTITVDSLPGKGTEFTVTFPSAFNLLKS
jgi:signal transduction histidine kinase